VDELLQGRVEMGTDFCPHAAVECSPSARQTAILGKVPHSLTPQACYLLINVVRCTVLFYLRKFLYFSFCTVYTKSLQVIH